MMLFDRDIWSRFLAFESQVGDLASIVKVEKRRAQTIEKVQTQHILNGIFNVEYFTVFHKCICPAGECYLLKIPLLYTQSI